MIDSLPDLSHAWVWPPQPSTVMGIGLVIMGAVLVVPQPELGGAFIVGGLGMIAVPDNTHKPHEPAAGDSEL